MFFPPIVWPNNAVVNLRSLCKTDLPAPKPNDQLKIIQTANVYLFVRVKSAVIETLVAHSKHLSCSVCEATQCKRRERFVNWRAVLLLGSRTTTIACRRQSHCRQSLRLTQGLAKVFVLRHTVAIAFRPSFKQICSTSLMGHIKCAGYDDFISY